MEVYRIESAEPSGSQKAEIWDFKFDEVSFSKLFLEKSLFLLSPRE